MFSEGSLISWMVVFSLQLFSLSASAEVLLELNSPKIQSELKKIPKIKIKTIYDPAYKKAEVFWAYSCKDLLKLSPVMKTMKDEESIIFEASDGYKIPSTLGILRNTECYLADSLGEASSQKKIPWKSFGHGKEASSPAPYYLIWKNGDIRKDKKPWPWSLIAIHKEESIDEALIRPKDASLNEGFKLYKENCLACHSINLVGGKIGFEMNIPKNITEYLSFEFFSSFALAPESYRAQSKMPAQKLTVQELKAIWAYLKGKAQEKISEEISR